MLIVGIHFYGYKRRRRNKRMKQSIIIPYYKNKNELYFMLNTLFKYIPKNIEIIIVANNSDSTALDIKYPCCTILKYNQSLLYSKAANIGVDYASGEIITLLDQDIFVTSGWYEALLSKLLSSPNIGAVSSKMLNPTNNRIIEFGIEYTDYNSSHIGKDLLQTSPLTQDDICVSSACGGVLMTYKSLYQELHGMDEDMPYICCDCDYTLKLWEHHKEVWVVASSVVYHKSYTSKVSGKISDFSFWEHDSRWKFYQKNAHRMRYQMKQWMNKTYDFYLKNHTVQKKYIFINLTSYLNVEWYINTIRELLNISFYDTYTFPVNERNATKLQIYDYVPYDFMSLITPIIYLVDSFYALKDNALWYTMRDTKKDIIVDINGAICSIDELQKGIY